MRKFFVLIYCLFIVGNVFAVGENTPTSKSYIDSAMSQKQDTIERTTGNAQALTNTGTAGEYGTKDIYDSTGSYAEQTDALVDAQTMNAAVQNAVNAEFVCISWVDDDPTKDCLLMEIRGVTATGATTLPSGYTALEYLEPNRGAYIDTGIILTANFDIHIEGMVTNSGVGTASILFSTNTTQNLSVGIYNDTFLYSYINNSANNGGIRTGGIGNRFHIALSPHRIRHYDGTEKILERPYTPSSTALHLFGSAGGIRIYDAEIYDGTTLVSKCLPARRDSDGVLGMYDMVNNRFLTNAGSNEFIAGPVKNLYLPAGD